jgi:lipoprotein-anchoring transpeptidase ErfK/SrfK
MKTTLLLSSFIAIGGWMLTGKSDKESVKFTSYKVSKARKTFEKPMAPMRIVIDKSDYELSVYDAKGWYATYPVVFGADPMQDKRMEGDRYTPEGQFKILSKRPHDKWSRFLLLDYPTQESLVKFNQRKQRGEIPRNASPGGGVGIHGVWPHEDFVIDRYKNWTLGCISLKNADVQELYGYVPLGTPVTIKK